MTRFASVSALFQGIAVLLMAAACLVAAFGMYAATDMPALALLPLPLLPVAVPAAGVAALPGAVLCVVYSHGFGASGALALALSLALCLPVLAGALARRTWPERLPAAPGWTVRLRTPLFMAAAALLVLSMHRALPLYAMLVHAGTYVAAAATLPRPAAAVRTTWRTAAGNALLLLISTGLTLAAAEILLRIGFGEPQPAQVQVHPERIWTPAPHGVRVKAFEDPVLGAVYVEAPCGAQGFRERDYGPKPPGVCRILLVGDSFTFGDGLEWEQTYGRLLERRLNDAAGAPRFEVVNAGVAGYGPAQELSLLREIGFALDPDIVLVQLLLDNDISDDLSLAGKHLEAYNGSRFVDRLLRIQGSQRLLRMHQALRRRSALYSFLWRTNPDFRHSLLLRGLAVLALAAPQPPAFRGPAVAPGSAPA